MEENLSSELHRNLPLERPGRIDYTRKAFYMLPKLDKPNILDIGCGNGEPTIELAKLTNGHVTGIDINQTDLDKLEKKAMEQNLSDKIKTINMSMLNLNFQTKSFNIIWSEGAIWVMGFEKGLKDWRKLIKPNGYLVVHEMCWLAPDPPEEIREHWQKMYPGITTHQKNVEKIPDYGYNVLGHFPLPEDTWGKLYFDPLEKRIITFREKYKKETRAIAILDKEQKEIDIYRKYLKWYGSAYYIMQKV